MCQQLLIDTFNSKLIKLYQCPIGVWERNQLAISQYSYRISLLLTLAFIASACPGQPRVHNISIVILATTSVQTSK